MIYKKIAILFVISLFMGCSIPDKDNLYSRSYNRRGYKALKRITKERII